MKKELFIEHAKKKGARIIDDEDEIKINNNIVTEFHAIKSLFEYIDFDCQHNKNGGCRKHSNSKMCCCYDCFNRVGFFYILTSNDMTYYSKKFNVRNKTGFWREGKGCILSHKMRSTICLTYYCSHKNRPDFGYGITFLKNHLKELRRRI